MAKEAYDPFKQHLVERGMVSKPRRDRYEPWYGVETWRILAEIGAPPTPSTTTTLSGLYHGYPYGRKRRAGQKPVEAYDPLQV